MKTQKLLYLSLTIGIIFFATGGSLLAVYAVDYDYSHRMVQFAEFWAIARTGGGLMTGNESDLGIKVIPLSSDTGYLRVFHLQFNTSASSNTSFWVPVDILALYSAPSSPIFESEWLRSVGGASMNNLELFREGVATLHNISVYYENVVLNIHASNANYSLSLGLDRYTWSSGKNETTSGGGHLYRRSSEICYYPASGFVFYLADLNHTVLNIGYDSDNSWSFSMLASWNISFQQKYGAGLSYAGNATIADWHFRRLDIDTIGVWVNLNNTNYRQPVPAFVVVPWTPLLEASVFVVGLILSIVSFVVRRKFPDSLRSQGSR